MNPEEFDRIMDKVMAEVENSPPFSHKRPFGPAEVVRIPLMRGVETYIFGELEMGVYKDGKETPVIPHLSPLLRKVEGFIDESDSTLSHVFAHWNGIEWKLRTIWTRQN